MRLWHLLVQQVSKSDNPENPGSDNSARTKHQINAKYACGICAEYNSAPITITDQFADRTVFHHF